MTQLRCVDVQELMPDFASGRLAPERASAVERHVGSCGDCDEELALIRIVLAGRAIAPSDFAERLVGAVERSGEARVTQWPEVAGGRRSPTRRPVPAFRPWWGLSAAAVAALAIGIGISSEPGAVQGARLVDIAPEFEEGELWLSDDGLLAGAPELEDLSDEALLQLLEELSAEIGGGAGGAV